MFWSSQVPLDLSICVCTLVIRGGKRSVPRLCAHHEGHNLILFYFAVYIVYSHFSLAVLTYHSGSDLEMEGFVWVCGSRESP